MFTFSNSLYQDPVRRALYPHTTRLGAEFTRASGQWIEDYQGVLQYVGDDIPGFKGARLLGSEWYDTDLNGDPIPEATLEGIQLEEASTNKCECWAVPTPQDAGSELITNGGFDADTDWIKGAGVTISGGTANFVTTGDVINALYQSAGIAKGKVYQVTYTVSNYIAGSIQVGAGGISGAGNYRSQYRSSNGTYIEIIEAYGESGLANGNIIFYTINSFNAKIDDVSVKELPQAGGTKSFHDGSSWINNIPGIIIGGSNTDGELEIVSDSTEIVNAGLGNVCSEELVIKVTNSNITNSSYVTIDGTATNTNKHSVSSFCRAGSGSGRVNISGAAGIDFNNTSYECIKKENVTTLTTSKTEIQANANSVVYFIMPQLEEKAFATSPIVPSPLAIGPTTRDATLLEYPVIGNLPVNDFSIEMEITPWATGQGSKVLLSSYYDASNYFSIETTDTQIILKKVIAGTPYSATFAYAHIKDTLFTVKAIMSSTRGLGLSINAGTPVTDTNKDDCILGTTFEVGSMNDGSRFAGMSKNLKIYKYAKPASWLGE